MAATYPARSRPPSEATNVGRSATFTNCAASSQDSVGVRSPPKSRTIRTSACARLHLPPGLLHHQRRAGAGQRRLVAGQRSARPAGGTQLQNPRAQQPGVQATGERHRPAGRGRQPGRQVHAVDHARADRHGRLGARLADGEHPPLPLIQHRGTGGQKRMQQPAPPARHRRIPHLLLHGRQGRMDRHAQHAPLLSPGSGRPGGDFARSLGVAGPVSNAAAKPELLVVCGRDAVTPSARRRRDDDSRRPAGRSKGRVSTNRAAGEAHVLSRRRRPPTSRRRLPRRPRPRADWPGRSCRNPGEPRTRAPTTR